MPEEKYNYERPIPLVGGLAGVQNINAGYGWNWTGRERATNRVRNYFTRTSFETKGELKDHIEYHYHGIEFIDGGPADKLPIIVMPLPPHSFNHGIMDIVERELCGDAKQRDPFRSLPERPAPIRRERIMPANRSNR